MGPSLRLLPSTSATTLRKTQEPPLVIDGPFAETKEQLLGFYIVDVANLDEALDAARELAAVNPGRSEEHTSELQSHSDLVCRRPPRSSLFPYTTLFRSRWGRRCGCCPVHRLPRCARRRSRRWSSTARSPRPRNSSWASTSWTSRTWTRRWTPRANSPRSIPADRKSTRLNSSHTVISYAVDHPDLLSFPTRRSSDLDGAVVAAAAQYIGYHAAQDAGAAAGHRRPVRRDQGTAPGLLHRGRREPGRGAGRRARTRRGQSRQIGRAHV